MSVLLINMRPVKTHHSKVIGNEITMRQVTVLAGERGCGVGQGDCVSCCHSVSVESGNGEPVTTDEPRTPCSQWLGEGQPGSL